MVGSAVPTTLCSIDDRNNPIINPARSHRICCGLIAEGAGAVVLSSHILDMLERICTRIIVLHRGKVVGDFERSDLDTALEKPEHRDLTSLYLHLTGQSDLLS